MEVCVLKLMDWVKSMNYLPQNFKIGMSKLVISYVGNYIGSHISELERYAG